VEADRRASILDAARRAVGKRGFARTTVRDVAREAGVAQALIHYYFATKEALFLSLVRLMLDEQLTRLRREIAGAEGPERALAGLALARDRALGDTRAWRLFFEVLASRSREGAGRELSAAFAERHATVADEIGRVAPAEDARTLALLVDAVMLGLAAERLAGTRDAEVEAAYDAFVGLLRGRIGG
jgi:AcrR family transcriptional regulator